MHKALPKETLKGGHEEVSSFVKGVRPSCGLTVSCAKAPAFYLDPRKQDSSSPDVNQWIKKMLRQGVLEEVEQKDVKWLTKHMAVPKKDTSEPRIVGHFGALNKVTEQVLAKSQDPLKIARRAAQFEWKAKLDLTKGFYTLEVDPTTRPWLCLTAKGRFFAYRRMPMGISAGPAFFSRYGDYIKTLLPTDMLPHLEVYQDDFIVFGNDKSEVARIVKTLKRILEEDGATVNEAKSFLKPQRMVPILGYAVARTVEVPKEKILATASFIKAILEKPLATKNDRAKILGKLQYLAQRDPKVSQALQPAYAIMSALPDQTTEAVVTEVEKAAFDAALRHIRHPEEGGTDDEGMPPVTVFSDASDTHYCVKVGKKTHVWAHKIAAQSSTYKEIAAVVKASKELHDWPARTTWFLDNQAAVAILNARKSRSSSCSRLLDHLRPFLDAHVVNFQFVTGKNNPADHGSRRTSLTSAQALKKATYAEAARHGRAKAKKQLNSKIAAKLVQSA